MPSPGHHHRVRRPLSQAAAGAGLQKPCQRREFTIINVLALIGGAPGRAESATAAHNPANNSCRQRRGKYPLTIPA
jgi:hypothetical protein